MGSTKHEKSFVDFEQPYEQNIIGLKGIFYFGIGLFVLIVVTFGLMWALMIVLEDDAREKKASDNPMQMSERDSLPPEPRLQAAPGFGVESANGKVNLELNAPQAEYWELRKQWDEMLKNGHKDPATGTIISLPIDQAKERFLQEPVKTKAGVDAGTPGQSQRIVSDSSSGRLASEVRR